MQQVSQLPNIVNLLQKFTSFTADDVVTWESVTVLYR